MTTALKADEQGETARDHVANALQTLQHVDELVNELEQDYASVQRKELTDAGNELVGNEMTEASDGLAAINGRLRKALALLDAQIKESGQ